MPYRPPIRAELIRWARDRAGIPLETALDWFPKYEQWESGEAHPTMNQLRTLASRTRTPLGYFFLPEPPVEELPIPDYRTVGDRNIQRPSPDLLATVFAMQRRKDWMRDYLIEVGIEPLAFVGSATTNTAVSDVAESIREALGLSIFWAQGQPNWKEALRHLTDAADAAGILVVQNGIVGNNTYRKLDSTEFRGFVLTDPYAPLIFVNRVDALAAQMFTVAHELAHIWIGKDGVFNLDGLEPAPFDVERYCDRVAAEFLVPERAMRQAWGSGNDSFPAIARRFKVSEVVAARRALDLGLITRRDYFEFYNTYLEEDRRREADKGDGGNFYFNQPFRIGERFAKAVIRATKEGRLLFRDAYRLTDLTALTFKKYASAIGYEL